MAKELTPNQKRCEYCDCLKITGGKWTCEECFGQLVEDIDDCPDGITLDFLEEVEKKQKENRVDHGARAAAPTSEKKTRERKPDLEKEEIVRKLSEFLESLGENVTISNPSKVVEFDIGENHYKLDLIRQRKPKK